VAVALAAAAFGLAPAAAGRAPAAVAPARAGVARPTPTPAARCEQAPGRGLTLANVAATGSRLVAVGSDGLIATSDGAGWQVRPTPTQHALRGVAWTGSGWVVVGDVGTVLASRDGRRWAIADVGPPAGLRAIAARGGVVSAGGAGGVILSSVDGGTWLQPNSGTTEDLWGGTVWRGQIYFSGQESTVVRTSDGVNWTAVATHPRSTGNQTSPRPFLWQLAPRGKLLVAVGDFGAILRSSADGSLRAVSSPTDEILRGVVASPRRFVAVGSSGVILYSSDGLHWQIARSPTTVDLRGVAYTGHRFVAVGDQSTVISSSDGLHWRIDATAMPCALLSVAHGAGRFVAVGGSGQLLISADGRRWSPQARPTTEDLYTVAYGPHGFVAAGALGTVLTSTDGRHWVRRASPTRLNLHAAFWTGREYLLGGDRSRLLASANGRRWRRVSFPGFHSIRAFASANGTLVAAGAGTIARRNQTGRWSLIAYGLGRFQTGVAAGHGRFVIVGHNGEALLSTDGGRTWLPTHSGVAVNFDTVAWTGTRFLATGEGVAVTSPDGVTWEPVALPVKRSIRSLSTTNSAIVGVGDGDTIIRSLRGRAFVSEGGLALARR
jgi:hypothetical protein